MALIRTPEQQEIELYSISEKRLRLYQECIELDKKERHILKQIRSAVL